jgi:hypothetical protein
VVRRSAPCRCIWNSCLRQGRLRAMTFRTTAYLEGKPVKGQQPADESGNKAKGGTFVFRKFSVHGETGQVSNPSSRVMTSTSVIPSLWWRRQNPIFPSMIWKCSLWRATGNEPERGQTGTYTQLTFHMRKSGIAYEWRRLWRRNPHTTWRRNTDVSSPRKEPPKKLGQSMPLIQACREGNRNSLSGGGMRKCKTPTPI